MKRKTFLHRAVIGSGGFIAMPLLLPAHASPDLKNPKADQLPPEKVKEFVIAGHGNFDKTKELLQQQPALLYATYDWGNGDFETALEGAGHTGNKEIANFLIDKGGRTNLFVLTMLGKTQIVKSFLETFPSYLMARGPHGLTLLHHAQKGGNDAKELLDYFQSLGLKETVMKL